MRSNLPGPYTQRDVERARTKGQLIGWVQGLAVGVGGMLVLRLLGWIPALAAIGVGGFLLYKLFSWSRRKG